MDQPQAGHPRAPQTALASTPGQKVCRRGIGVKEDVREGFCNINVGRFTADPDVECLLCPETFHHPEQHQVELQTKVKRRFANISQSLSTEKAPLPFALASHMSTYHGLTFSIVS